VEYLQFGLDQLDQNKAFAPAGKVIGKLKKVDNKPTAVTIVVSCVETRGPHGTVAIVFAGLDGECISEFARPREWESSLQRCDGIGYGRARDLGD